MPPCSGKLCDKQSQQRRSAITTSWRHSCPHARGRSLPYVGGGELVPVAQLPVEAQEELVVGALVRNLLCLGPGALVKEKSKTRAPQAKPTIEAHDVAGVSNERYGRDVCSSSHLHIGETKTRSSFEFQCGGFAIALLRPVSGRRRLVLPLDEDMPHVQRSTPHRQPPASRETQKAAAAAAQTRPTGHGYCCAIVQHR